MRSNQAPGSPTQLLSAHGVGSDPPHPGGRGRVEGLSLILASSALPAHYVGPGSLPLCMKDTSTSKLKDLTAFTRPRMGSSSRPYSNRDTVCSRLLSQPLWA